MEKVITLQHGSGGTLMAKLIGSLFYKYFANDILAEAHDAARLPAVNGRLAFTTDSYVINPLFFPGGNIGKLAVCGTVNDLAMSGAKPLYMSCGFIIEAGFPFDQLEEIVASMAHAAQEAGIHIVTGDTKVVEKGAVDKLFINTSGIGVIPAGINISGRLAQAGDVVLSSGTLGDHGMTIMIERQKLHLESRLESDCAPLNSLVAAMLAVCPQIHVLRDPTRGGLATTLNEIAEQSQVGIELMETAMPVRSEVRAMCEVLGLDPLYLANEGKLAAIVPAAFAEEVLSAMRANLYGKDAAIIGKVVENPQGKVYVRTAIGGRRIVDMLVADPLPRIC